MWLPILLVTALPPILAVPLDEYELPWLAMLGLAVTFAACGPVATAEYWVTGVLRERYAVVASLPRPDGQAGRRKTWGLSRHTRRWGGGCCRRYRHCS